MSSSKKFSLSTSLISLIICSTLVGCNSDSATNTSEKLTAPTTEKSTEVETAFPLYTKVFDIPIRGALGTNKDVMVHAANVMAQYLDNNEDGIPDNQAIVDYMLAQEATLLMAENRASFEAVASKLKPKDSYQDLLADEVKPQGTQNGEFDATLEEVLHLITHVGYAGVYPEVFGEVVGSSIANAMDIARGGRFESIPKSYPDNAWYTYDDETCEYGCMVTEYTYWSLTSILGAQNFQGREDEISDEWKLNTKEKVSVQDPAIFSILTDPSFELATVLPDGHYSAKEFTIKNVGSSESISTDLATELDEKFLTQIKKSMDVVKSQKLWEGYEYRSVPQYFIRRENGKPVTAFVINPQTTIDKAQQLGANESQGLNVVKFEGSMLIANDKLKAGNDLYDFDFNIDGKEYFIQAYTKDEVEIADPKMTSAFSFAVHEVFHAYQGQNFKDPTHYEQLGFDKFDQYPLNNELLALQLMSMELLKGFPVASISKEEATTALKQYVVLVNEMLKRDTTAHSGSETGLIYKHGLGQELFEGSALYIDQMVSRKVLVLTKDNRFIYHNPFEMDKVIDGYATLMTKKNVVDYFAFQVFYYTGANAIWLLNQSGYDVKKLENGIYPFDAAKEYLKMSEVEEMNLLAKLKQSTQWTQAQTVAIRYNSLQ